MAANSIIGFLNPWRLRRLQEERLLALRRRDGDQCRRCRRPIRFDLPPGRELGVKIEPIHSAAPGEKPSLDNLCLTHARCNASAGNDTAEVKERARRKNEAELLAKQPGKRRAA